MDGLKDKFSSFPKNDPLRISNLTILPDCWSLGDIINEFDISIRMAEKARDLKNEFGI